MEQNELMQMETAVMAYEEQVKSLVIASKEDVSRAGDVLSQVKLFIKTFDAKKKDLVKPFKDAIRKLENEFDPQIDKAKEVKDILDRKIGDYQMQEIRRQQEEEKQRRIQEMLRLEREKEALEAQAVQENNTAILNQAIKIEQRQERVMSEPLKASQTVRGEVANTNVVMVWDYRVVSEREVPREYCSPDAGELRKAVNSGVREIPGVEIFQKPRVVSR